MTIATANGCLGLLYGVVRRVAIDFDQVGPDGRNAVAWRRDGDRMGAMASALLARLLRASDGDLPAEYARQLLSVTVTPTEQARCDALSEKAQLGTLTSEERGELEEIVAANDLLIILHAKAELSLRAARPETPARRS